MRIFTYILMPLIAFTLSFPSTLHAEGNDLYQILNSEFSIDMEIYQKKKRKTLLENLWAKTIECETRSIKQLLADYSEGINRTVAEMNDNNRRSMCISNRIEVAKKYVEIGIYDAPKSILRSIILESQEGRWPNIVKNAEFVLEDIKQAESKQGRGKTKK